MISHIVLFRPRADLSQGDRAAFGETLARVREDIPSIRGFRVGRRVTHGRGYEQVMRENFSFAAVIDFDDLAGLQSYLEHPAHAKISELFAATLEAALVYDYEMWEDAAAARELAAEPPGSGSPAKKN